MSSKLKIGQIRIVLDEIRRKDEPEAVAVHARKG